MPNKGKYKVDAHYRNKPNGGKTFVDAHYRSYPGKGKNEEPKNSIELEGDTGWEKEHSKEYRRRLVYEATDGRKTRHNRYVEAGRKMQALANLNQDTETSRKAKNDADYFYKMADKYQD